MVVGALHRPPGEARRNVTAKSQVLGFFEEQRTALERRHRNRQKFLPRAMPGPELCEARITVERARVEDAKASDDVEISEGRARNSAACANRDLQSTMILQRHTV